MRIALLGVGNDMKGDDGIGIIASDMVYEDIRNVHDCLLIKTNVPENYIRKIIEFRPNTLIVFDAADFNGKYGEVRLIEEDDIVNFSISTHNSPLSIFFEIIRSEKNMKIHLIGIQKKNTEFGEDISEEILSSLPRVVSLAKDLL